ncbi:MAG: thioredoxin family protein [Deltaproteobacteria bacterium]|nr:thioredoxin family protein [Deltaproteobacteria bacterium]
MNIRVLGRGCTKCNLTEEIVRQVLLEECIDAQVEKVTGAKQIAQYGVFLTPAVMIDGEVKCVGRIPKKEEIKAWISK